MGLTALNPGWRIALCVLAWLAGLALQMQQPRLWPAAHYGLICGLGALMLGLAGLCWWLRSRLGSGFGSWLGSCLGRLNPALPLLFLACILVGAGSTGWRATALQAQALAAELEGADLVLTGVVASLPQVGATGTRFVFAMESAHRAGAPEQGLSVPGQIPLRIALGWYHNEHDEPALAGAGPGLAGDTAAALRAGQRWRLPVRLKRPHGAMNPGSFDAELWWWEQRLRATGYVRVAAGKAQAELLTADAGYGIDRLRQGIRDDIQRRVSDQRLAGVIAALVVGDQAAIEREDWDLFRNTGIAHLMSISGLHVTMFAWAAGLGVGWAWRRSTRLMLWLPAPQVARWGGLMVATAYALLAGWGVPAVRTLLMLACAVLLRSAGMRWPWLLVLCAAALVVTVFDPWALLQAGFWLSFAAVGLLLVSESGDAATTATAAHGWRERVRGHLRSQVVATLGLAPLSLVFFQQLSVVGFVANLVAIPWVTLLVTPVALLGALLPPVWTVAAWAVQALTLLMAWLASFPFAVWTVAAAAPWAAAAGMAGALLAVLPLPWRLRAAALPLMLPLLWPAPPTPAQGQFDAVVADVGQGTAVLLRTRSHVLLYDTGPQYSRDSDAGARVLLPLLRARGESRIDLLVLSHRDIDHVGGAASLLSGAKVAAISSSLEAGHPLSLRAPHQRCEDGQSWSWDGVHFEILHPTSEEHASARKPNAVSCVLRATDAQGRSLLLTGDIEAAQEAALLQRHGAALASTWLLVPHHGSRSSSTTAFLQAVKPHTALVQAGHRSRFGHPAPDVLRRYEEHGIRVERSDQCGAWQWRDGQALCTRDQRRRYWHWVP